MMRLRALLFAVCMLALIVPIQAATYYVDAERGNDTNNGTSATAAWKTLSRVNQGKFRSGDWNWTAGTLYIYAENDPRRLFLKRGVEVGVRPIGINLTGLAYITIRNVRVCAANAAPYALGANIWGIAAGRKGPSPRGLRIERSEIVNSAGDGLHLEGVQESAVDANLVANNENVGIQIYRSLEAFPVSDVTVSNNEVHHNHFIGINMAGCPAGESCRTIRNEKQLTVTRTKVTGNKCYG